MMRARIEQVSQGIYEHIPTEDVVGCLQREHSILAWAIDGASTLTEAPFTTYDDVSDAGWFARRLARLLKEQFKETPFSTEKLRRGLNMLREEYLHAASETLPLWARPVAAAIIVEVRQTAAEIRMSIYRYADCFALVSQGVLPDTDRTSGPASQPTPTYELWKPFSGFRGRELARLRRRRCQQQKNEFSTALTLNPASAMNAVEERRTLHAPAHIVLGSDGLSRVWDTYRLMSGEQAMRMIVQHGLSELLRLLRAFEASTPTGTAELKRRDDACGIHLFLP